MSAVFVFLCCGRQAQAATLPTAQEIRARIAQAAGRVPDSFSREIHFARGGSTGVQTDAHVGSDFRNMKTAGFYTSGTGSFQGQAWHQNANGQTVFDQPDPGNGVQEHTTTLVSATAQPVDGYVLREINEDGDGTSEVVDAKTWHVVRSERVTAIPRRAVVTVYDDFRTVEGYTQPWHWKVSDGKSEDDTEYTLTSFRTAGVSKDDVAIPRPRRALVEFPSGEPVVALPVRKVGNKLVIRLDFKGQGFDFGIDTGAPGIFMQPGTARLLGLVPTPGFANDAGIDPFAKDFVNVPEIKVGDLTMRDVIVGTAPDSLQESEDTRIVGVLGFDFIAELLLKLDYAGAAVTAYADSARALPKTARTFPIDVRLGHEVPFATLAFDGATSDRFFVDTGYFGTILFSNSAVRRYPKKLVGNNLEGSLAFAQGVGGILPLQSAIVSDVNFGGISAKKIGCAIIPIRSPFFFDADGLIGAGILSHFDVWLDYADSQILLVAPGANTP